MFEMNEDFSVCDESGMPYSFTELHNHRYTTASGSVRDGVFEMYRPDAVYSLNIPDLKTFRLRAGVGRTAPKIRTLWKAGYGFDNITGIGYIIQVDQSSTDNSLRISHIRADGEKNEVIASEEFREIDFIPGKIYVFTLDRHDEMIDVSFDGRLCSFASESVCGGIRVSEAGSPGTMLLGYINIESDEEPICRQTLRASCRIPCYDGGSEPYILGVSMSEYKNGVRRIDWNLTGGAYSRAVRDYQMGIWSVQYDVFTDPFIRPISGGETRKLFIRNGTLVFSEENPFAKNAKLFMGAEKMPFGGSFFLPPLHGGRTYVGFGYELFRRLGNEFQSDRSEFVFSDHGNLLYYGDPISDDCQLRVTSPADKAITRMIPEGVTERDKALTHARGNHYFMDDESVCFTIVAACKKERFLNFRVSLTNAYFREIRDLTFTAEKIRADLPELFGENVTELSVRVGSLPQGVYHIHISVLYGQKVIRDSYSAFEVIDTDSGVSPRESSGLPFMYSGEGAPPDIRYNCPDPWIEKPDMNACHYFDCLLIQPEIAEERRVWELTKLYRIKLFSWVDIRTVPSGKTPFDYPLTLRNSDFLDVDSRSGEGYHLFHNLLQNYPVAVGIMNDFRREHPEYDAELRALGNLKETDWRLMRRLFEICPEEWISYFNRRANEHTFEFQNRIREVNPDVKFGKYGALGFYTTNHMNAYAGKWRMCDMENLHRIRDGFLIFEDYAFIVGQQPYYCAWGLMGYMLHTPKVRVLAEFFSDFDPVCPDGAVMFANPPMGKCHVPAYQVKTQLYEYMYASCVLDKSGFRYYHDNSFQLLQSYNTEASARLTEFLRAWGTYLENRPAKPLRAPVFISAYSPEEDIYDFDIGRKCVNNRSLAGISYMYQIMASAGLPGGVVTDWDGFTRLAPDDTDLVVVPSLRYAPAEVIRHLRYLSEENVSLFAVGDVTGLEDLFGVYPSGVDAELTTLTDGSDTERISKIRDKLYYTASDDKVVLSAVDGDGKKHPVLIRNGANALLNIYIGHVGIERSGYVIADTANISRLLRKRCVSVIREISRPFAVSTDSSGICLFENERGGKMILVTDYSPYGTGHGKEITVTFGDINVSGVAYCDPFDTGDINPLMEGGHLKGFSFDIREREAKLFRLVE